MQRKRTTVRLTGEVYDFILSLVGNSDTLSFNLALEDVVLTHPHYAAHQRRVAEEPGYRQSYESMVRAGRRAVRENRRRTGNTPAE